MKRVSNTWPRGWLLVIPVQKEKHSLTRSLRCRVTNRTRYFLLPFFPFFSSPTTLLTIPGYTLESAVRNSTRIDNAPAIFRPMAEGEGLEGTSSVQGDIEEKGERVSTPKTEETAGPR